MNCNRQFSTPLSSLWIVDSFPRATTYNQGRIPPIYPLWRCTRVLGAGNGSQADQKRNNNAIQTPKLSQYRARGVGESNRINFLESYCPQDSLYLNELISASSCICELCHLYSYGRGYLTKLESQTWFDATLVCRFNECNSRSYNSYTQRFDTPV